MPNQNTGEGSGLPLAARKILALLQGLTAHPGGVLLHRRVRDLLAEQAAAQDRIEAAYADLVDVLLDGIARHIPAEDLLRLELRVMQRFVRPPLTEMELRQLREGLRAWSEAATPQIRGHESELQAAVHPLLDALGANVEVPPGLGAATGPEGEAPQGPGEGVGAAGAAATREQPPAGPAEGAGGGERPGQQEAEGARGAGQGRETGGAGGETPARTRFDSTDNTEVRVTSVYRHHLDEKSRDFQHLQARLSREIEELLTEHEEFAAAIDAIRGALAATAEGGGSDEHTQRLVRELDVFRIRHGELGDRLQESYRMLQEIAGDSRRLSEELNRVRQLSLTDELTGLPNRRAFQRRLQDEISRVNRYGSNLGIALIDLDEFKRINDEFGHAVGDRVLSAYANDVMSAFRHHDMVARYGGEEFAILLPNTELEGVMAALRKVRERALGTEINVRGTQLRIPTFSAGVTLYHRGEPAEQCLARADVALYRAKEAGRDRIEAIGSDVAGAGEGRPGEC